MLCACSQHLSRQRRQEGSPRLGLDLFGILQPGLHPWWFGGGMITLDAEDVLSPFRVAPGARPACLPMLLIPKTNALLLFVCLQAYGPGRPYHLPPPAGRYSWN